jgi:hypothetical protein
MIDTGHWMCTQVFSESAYGFVYLITNTVYAKMYVGKKQMKSVMKRPPLKGKTKKRHSVIDTDWRTYTSSCNELNADIEKMGKDKFTFEILRFCESKSELAYYEAKEQFDRNVLLTNDYYNGIINLRVGRIKGVVRQ